MLTAEDIAARIDETGHGSREIHIVGGCHPTLPLSYFEDILRTVRERLPKPSSNVSPPWKSPTSPTWKESPPARF